MTDREVMEYDVVIVGAGPGRPRLRDPPEAAASPTRTSACWRKASSVGAHSLSGAVLEPGRARKAAAELAQRVHRHESAGGRRRRAADDEDRLVQAAGLGDQSLADAQSRQLHRLARPAHAVARAAGREARRRHLPGLRGRRSAVRRATARSKACASATWASNKDGTPGPNYTPGVEIHAGTTMLAEGSRGSISKQLIAKFNLREGVDPPTFGLGFKELWQLPPGRVQARPHRARVRLAARHRAPTAAASSITSTRIACTSATSSA